MTEKQLIPVEGSKQVAAQTFILAIHGGGTHINSDNTTPEQRAQYRAALTDALKAGHEVLKHGGEAMDAAVAAVAVLEDCPFFNSAKGAVFNIAGKNELEASIMLTKPPASRPDIPAIRRGISAPLLTRTKNPSHLVRALYLAPELAPHPTIAGPTAESIGEQHFGIQTVDQSYYWTETRWNYHRSLLECPVEPIVAPAPHGPANGVDPNSETTQGLSLNGTQRDPLGSAAPLDLMTKGTVGAVALDIRGCIATVTSTGGRTNKLVGRIGDTAIMGAGFWAEEWTRQDGTQCGVGISGNGDGDCFVRICPASTIARRMQFLDESVDVATQQVVDDVLKIGSKGGVVAVDKQGNVALPFSTNGMCRGLVRSDGIPLTAIFREDDLAPL